MAFDREGRRIVSGSHDDTVRVWDAATGDCLEVIPGSGDVAAIAAPASVFPWRAMSRNLETVIEPASGGEAVAWFPAATGAPRDPPLRPHLGRVGGQSSVPDPA